MKREMKGKKGPATPKSSLRILNTREKKELNQRIYEQWGCTLDKDMVFLMSNKGRLYVCDRDVGMLDFSRLRVDSMGLYVATVDEKGARLSIEGSQLLGSHASKNVIEIDYNCVRDWFKGHDLDAGSKGIGYAEGFVILKSEEGDFLGCGKVTDKGILNFVPKARRVAEDS